MSRCHNPGLNPRQASFVSGSGVSVFFGFDAFSGLVRTSVAMLFALTRARWLWLAKNEVRGQSGFARLFVLSTHVLAGFGQGLDRRIEIDAVPRSDFIRGNHERSP